MAVAPLRGKNNGLAISEKSTKDHYKRAVRQKQHKKEGWQCQPS